MAPDGIVKLRLTAVSDPQHGGLTAGSSPVSWGLIDELFVNLTVPRIMRWPADTVHSPGATDIVDDDHVILPRDMPV